MKQKLQKISQKLPKKLPKISRADLAKIHARHVHYAVASVTAFFLIVSSGAAWYYHDRALPGVHVANLKVSGKTRDEVKQAVMHQRDTMKVHFVDHGADKTTPAKDLGVTVNVEKTTDQVMLAGRNGGFWRAIQFWQHDDVPLLTTTDIGVFKDYVTKQFPALVKDAKDAELAYNDQAKQFEIKAGQVGQGFDVKKFEELLPGLVNKPQTVNLAVSSAPVQPLITDKSLEATKAQINERVALSLKFIYQGKVMYTVDPPDIAKWVNFTAEPQAGKVAIVYDKAKISQFLSQQVGPAIAQPAIDRKVIKDPNTGSEIVIQQGQVGRKLQDVDGLAKEIEQSLTKNQSLQKEVTITEAPYKTVALTSYDKWVEVDLSEQRTTLYTGNTPIQSFTISSGTSASPTVVGTFTVWSKNVSQTMTGGSRASGDFYYLPNVTWVTYFYQDYSFHTAYWHNNFGHPMSHGCVNMRAADAKVLYDFAPIGTKVVVHQ